MYDKFDLKNQTNRMKNSDSEIFFYTLTFINMIPSTKFQLVNSTWFLGLIRKIIKTGLKKYRVNIECSFVYVYKMYHNFELVIIELRYYFLFILIKSFSTSLLGLRLYGLFSCFSPTFLSFLFGYRLFFSSRIFALSIKWKKAVVERGLVIRIVFYFYLWSAFSL